MLPGLLIVNQLVLTGKLLCLNERLESGASIGVHHAGNRGRPGGGDRASPGRPARPAMQN